MVGRTDYVRPQVDSEADEEVGARRLEVEKIQDKLLHSLGVVNVPEWQSSDIFDLARMTLEILTSHIGCTFW